MNNWRRVDRWGVLEKNNLWKKWVHFLIFEILKFHFPFCSLERKKISLSILFDKRKKFTFHSVLKKRRNSSAMREISLPFYFSIERKFSNFSTWPTSNLQQRTPRPTKAFSYNYNPLNKLITKICVNDIRILLHFLV